MDNYFKEMLEAMYSTMLPADQHLVREHGIQGASLLSFLSANDIQQIDLTKRIQRGRLADARAVATTDQVEFFQGQFDNEVTNMPGSSYTLPQDEHKVIYGIWIENGNAQAEVKDSPWVPGFGPGNENAFITLVNNGVVVAQSLPLTDAMEGLTDRSNGFIPLREPFVWKGQTNLIARINWKEQNPVATATLRVSYEYFGLIS